MKWRPLIIGGVLGAALALFVGMGQKGGATNPLGITGKPNQPYQFRTDAGQGVRGG
jgi:hypothetical protein